jgi:DNA-binding NarL/FixJ family response regulator
LVPREARCSAAIDGLSPVDDQGPPLSEIEKEILQRLASGETTRQIAAELHIPRASVKTHIESIFEKLGGNQRPPPPSVA